MKDATKTKAQLILELESLRQNVAQLQEEVADKHRFITESEEKLRLFYEYVPLAYQSLDFEGNILEVNKSWLVFMGYSREEVIGRWFGDFLDPESRNGFSKEDSGSKETGEIRRNEIAMVRKDGSHAVVSFDGRVEYDEKGGFKRTHCIMKDLTERVRMERALKEEMDKEQKYLNIVEVILVAIDAEQKVTLINRKGCELLGYEESEIIGKNWHDNFFPERMRAELKGTFHKLMAGEIGPSKYSVYPVLTKSGEERTIAWRKGMLYDKQGKIVGILSSGEDITEREQWEEEMKLRTQILDSARDSIFLGDLDGNIVYANEMAYKSRGYSKEEFLTMNAHQLTAPEHAKLVPQRIRETLEKGINLFESAHLHKDGSIMPLEMSHRLIELGDKKFILSVSRDITERKRVEDKLKLNTLLLDSVNDSILLRDLDGNILFANEVAYKSRGYSEEEFLSMNIHQFTTPEHTKLIELRTRETLEKGLHFFETAHLCKDGSTMPIEVNSRVIELDGEKHILSVIRDISDRKKAEEKVREAEARYRGLFEQSPDGIMIIDSETTEVIDFNDAACKQLGYSRDEFAGMKVADFEAMETAEETQKHIGQIRQADISEFVTKHRTKQGEIIDVMVLSKPIYIAGKIYNLSIHRDITKQKRMEDELKLRAQLLDNATDFIFMRELNGKIVYANEMAYESHGYSKEEIISMDIRQLLLPDEANLTESRTQMILEKGKFSYESTHVCKDGSTLPMEVYSRVIESGGKQFILSICRDITERKRMEDELKLRAQFLDNASDFIFLRDLDGKFVYVNQTALNGLGYSRDEFMELKVDQIVAPGQRWVTDSLKEEMMAKGKVIFETASLCKDGSIIPAEVHARIIEAGGKKLVLSSVRDIAERKKLEDAIRQLAHYDSLTGLPNRNLFNDRMSQALAHAARYEEGLALMMMDLDKFKDINDTLGHDAGDKLLKDVSIRLVSVVRRTDTVSRMGGDEFVLLLSKVDREEDVTNIAQKIVEAIREPFSYSGHEFTVTTSIGIAFYPTDGKDSNTLLKHADLAMYSVKYKGRNGYLRYAPKMNDKSTK